jgi:hypothetical protein
VPFTLAGLWGGANFLCRTPPESRHPRWQVARQPLIELADVGAIGPDTVTPGGTLA